MNVVERVTKAYEVVGKTLDNLRFRKRNYLSTFNTPSGQAVLSDLARFCRANESCYAGDRDKHLIAEGRREVWLRITQHLNLSSQELFTLYRGGTVERLLLKEEDND